MEKQANLDTQRPSSESLVTQQPPKLSPSGTTKYVAMGLIVILVGAGGFFAGTQFAKTTANTSNTAAAGSMGNMRGSGMGRMGTFGTVTAITTDSITVTVESRGGPDQTQSSDSGSASSKTYKITSSTKVTNNRETAAVSDIKSGDTVMIRTSTSDTTTATAISLNPSMGGGMMGGGAPGTTQSDTPDDTTDQTTDGSST